MKIEININDELIDNWGAIVIEPLKDIPVSLWTIRLPGFKYRTANEGYAFKIDSDEGCK